MMHAPSTSDLSVAFGLLQKAGKVGLAMLLTDKDNQALRVVSATGRTREQIEAMPLRGHTITGAGDQGLMLLGVYGPDTEIGMRVAASLIERHQTISAILARGW